MSESRRRSVRLTASERRELVSERGRLEAERAQLEAERAQLEAERAQLEAKRENVESQRQQLAEQQGSWREALQEIRFLAAADVMRLGEQRIAQRDPGDGGSTSARTADPITLLTEGTASALVELARVTTRGGQVAPTWSVVAALRDVVRDSLGTIVGESSEEFSRTDYAHRLLRFSLRDEAWKPLAGLVQRSRFESPDRHEETYRELSEQADAVLLPLREKLTARRPQRATPLEESGSALGADASLALPESPLSESPLSESPLSERPLSERAIGEMRRSLDAVFGDASWGSDPVVRDLATIVAVEATLGRTSGGSGLTVADLVALEAGRDRLQQELLQSWLSADVETSDRPVVLSEDRGLGQVYTGLTDALTRITHAWTVSGAAQASTRGTGESHVERRPESGPGPLVMALRDTAVKALLSFPLPPERQLQYADALDPTSGPFSDASWESIADRIAPLRGRSAVEVRVRLRLAIDKVVESRLAFEGLVSLRDPLSVGYGPFGVAWSERTDRAWTRELPSYTGIRRFRVADDSAAAAANFVLDQSTVVPTPEVQEYVRTHLDRAFGAVPVDEVSGPEALVRTVVGILFQPTGTVHARVRTELVAALDRLRDQLRSGSESSAGESARLIRQIDEALAATIAGGAAPPSTAPPARAEVGPAGLGDLADVAAGLGLRQVQTGRGQGDRGLVIAAPAESVPVGIGTAPVADTESGAVITDVVITDVVVADAVAADAVAADEPWARGDQRASALGMFDSALRENVNRSLPAEVWAAVAEAVQETVLPEFAARLDQLFGSAVWGPSEVAAVLAATWATRDLLRDVVAVPPSATTAIQAEVARVLEMAHDQMTEVLVRQLEASGQERLAWRQPGRPAVDAVEVLSAGMVVAVQDVARAWEQAVATTQDGDGVGTAVTSDDGVTLMGMGPRVLVLELGNALGVSLAQAMTESNDLVQVDAVAPSFRETAVRWEPVADLVEGSWFLSSEQRESAREELIRETEIQIAASRQEMAARLDEAVARRAEAEPTIRSVEPGVRDAVEAGGEPAPGDATPVPTVGLSRFLPERDCRWRFRRRSRTRCGHGPGSSCFPRGNAFPARLVALDASAHVTSGPIGQTLTGAERAVLDRAARSLSARCTRA